MARKIDIARLKRTAIAELAAMRERIEDGRTANLHYLLLRWMCKMTAVDAHGTWERYVEGRLVAAVNHSPAHFIAEQNIKGVSHISYGLAQFIIRGGNRYFDFRSMGDLISRTDKWIPKAQNIFRALPVADRNYIDTLAAIRNFVVHGSDAAQLAYRTQLQLTYGIRYPPQPDEFLFALDNRAGSPARYQPRLYGLLVVLERTIQNS